MFLFLMFRHLPKRLDDEDSLKDEQKLFVLISWFVLLLRQRWKLSFEIIEY